MAHVAEGVAERPRAERGCPESGALVAVALGGLASDERAAIVEHVARCTDCAAELSLAYSAADLVAESSPRGATASRRVSTVRRLVPLAAGIVLAVSGVVAYRSLPSSQGGFRGAENGLWAAEPQDGAQLRRRPEALAVRPREGDSSFTFDLFDVAFTRLASSGELPAPRFELPRELAFDPGATYFWRVTARGRGLEERSELFSFSLER